MIFSDGKETDKVGADPKKLQKIITDLAETASGSGSGSGSGGGAEWHGKTLPKGYSDVSDQVEVKGLELLNADSGCGGVRVLFEKGAPSVLGGGGGGEGKRDWVETDTDEQLMMFMPFQSTLKLHTILVSASRLSHELQVR